jgi:GNAT superfamily N-acetyltransferase
MTRRRRAPRIAIRELTEADDPAIGQAYRLLRRSFARHELMPLDEWRKSMRERTAGLWTDTAWHLIVAERDGAILGLVSGNYLGNVNVGMIGYLAVASAGRGLGLGSRLRRRLRECFHRDAEHISGEPLRGIVGEVSITNPWLKVLAGRPAVLPLDMPYFQPRFYPADGPSPFVFYYESVGRIRRRIPTSELRRILFAIWRRVYRIVRPLDRAAFRTMMRALEGRKSVGRHRGLPRPGGGARKK